METLSRSKSCRSRRRGPVFLKLGLVLAALLLPACLPAAIAAGVCAAGVGVYVAVDTRESTPSPPAARDAGTDSSK